MAGAGLRGLEKEQPTPIELSILYFSRTDHRLQGWDDIRLGGLGLRVVNTAVPPNTLVKASPGAGHGITGMRERVSMLNGEMTAGPTDDGGYEVAVFLPVTVQTEGEA